MKKGVNDQKFALVKRLTSIKAKAKILKYRFTIFSIPVFVFHVSTFSILVLTVARASSVITRKAKSASILTNSRTLFNEGRGRLNHIERCLNSVRSPRTASALGGRRKNAYAHVSIYKKTNFCQRALSMRSSSWRRSFLSIRPLHLKSRKKTHATADRYSAVG